MDQTLVTLGCIFFGLTALSLSRTVGPAGAVGMGERFCFSVLTVPLALICAALLWAGLGRSTPRPWSNGGAGAEWTCLELPRLGSDVCFRKGIDRPDHAGS